MPQRVLAAIGGPETVEVDAAELEAARTAAVRHGYLDDVLRAVEAKTTPAYFLKLLTRLARGPIVDERYRHLHPGVDDPDELLRPE